MGLITWSEITLHPHTSLWVVIQTTGLDLLTCSAYNRATVNPKLTSCKLLHTFQPVHSHVFLYVGTQVKFAMEKTATRVKPPKADLSSIKSRTTFKEPSDRRICHQDASHLPVNLPSIRQRPKTVHMW